MHVAVIGCCHGELETVYKSIKEIEQSRKIKIGLLLICGDFQAHRNAFEMNLMPCPPKYKSMGSYYKYYTGNLTAHCMTIVVGGNHESNLHFYELFYGGWIAPKIYFMGYAGIVNFNGLRIAGLSGIYKKHDYKKGYFEKPPFDDKGDMRSIIHIREYATQCLMQVKRKLHILLTHDWPLGIAIKGDMDRLLRIKPFFKQDIMKGKFGSMPAESLMKELQPDYLFSGHYHVKYSAVYKHDDKTTTKFLGLSKVKKNFDFLQILDFPEIVFDGKDNNNCLSYDPEWLHIVTKTYKFVPFTVKGLSSKQIEDFFKKNYSADEENINLLLNKLSDLKIPNNFSMTSPPFNKLSEKPKNFVEDYRQNIQTKEFCQKLGIIDMFADKHNSNQFNDINSDELNIEMSDESK